MTENTKPWWDAAGPLAREEVAVRSWLLLAGSNWWMKPGAPTDVQNSKPHINPALRLCLWIQPLNTIAGQLPPTGTQEDPQRSGVSIEINKLCTYALVTG